MSTRKITSTTVRADFNDPLAVVHYTRAAHFLGLWRSEQVLINQTFTDKNAPLIEAGCGSGRVTLGLWHEGYRHITAFDFAEELVEQARDLARSRDAEAIRFYHADATLLRRALPDVCHLIDDKPVSVTSGTARAPCQPMVDTPAGLPGAQGLAVGGRNEPPNSNASRGAAGFAGALFMFNGLMQIPGRENRRRALRELHAVCRPDAPLLFTTHDRDWSPTERALWRLEAQRWEKGAQDPRLVEFGDRYFEDETGRTFMHLPDRREILDDLESTGWIHARDMMRRAVAKESRAVLDFSDECRFWVARRGARASE